MDKTLSPATNGGRARCFTLEQGLQRAADIIVNEESRAKIEKALKNGLIATYEVTVRHRPLDGVHVEIVARTSQHSKVAYFAGLEGPSPERREQPQTGGNGE